MLGQWGVWTQAAARIYTQIRNVRADDTIPADLLTVNAQLTDANAAMFDADHLFRGCIPGIHEVLRRGGLLPSIRCLNAEERLSPGQSEEITRVSRLYPHLTDTDFVNEHRDLWLS